MIALYNFVNEKLSRGILLKDCKDKIHEYFDLETYNFCISKTKFNDNGYNKIKLEEYSNEIFEMILICWNENSETKIHDHPDNGCIMYLIEGKLEEQLYNKELILSNISPINKKNSSYMDNNIGYHKIKCLDKTISLHIYSPPNYKMQIMEQK